MQQQQQQQQLQQQHSIGNAPLSVEERANPLSSRRHQQKYVPPQHVQQHQQQHHQGVQPQHVHHQHMHQMQPPQALQQQPLQLPPQQQAQQEQQLHHPSMQQQQQQAVQQHVAPAEEQQMQQPQQGQQPVAKYPDYAVNQQQLQRTVSQQQHMMSDTLYGAYHSEPEMQQTSDLVNSVPFMHTTIVDGNQEELSEVDIMVQTPIMTIDDELAMGCHHAEPRVVSDSATAVVEHNGDYVYMPHGKVPPGFREGHAGHSSVRHHYRPHHANDHAQQHQHPQQQLDKQQRQLT
eukprot:Lankesteria_metandrocarpae@DN7363_c0_g1_i1.p1